MPHYPQSASGLNYFVHSFSNVTPGAANVKGAYSQIFAAAGFPSKVLKIGLIGSANSAQTWLFDLAQGAAGAEVPIISNLMSDQPGTGSSIGNLGWHTFPVAFPIGARMSVRCQCNITGRLLGLSIIYIDAGDTPGITPGNLITYGANTAGSRGTNIDPGGTANVKGAWVTVAASTTNLIQWLMINFGHFGASATNGQGWQFDIATGAVGAEVVLIQDIRVSSPAGSLGMMAPRSQEFLTYIPIGTRIAVRCSSDFASVATAPGRTMDVVLFGGTAPVESVGGAAGGSVAYVG